MSVFTPPIAKCINQQCHHISVFCCCSGGVLARLWLSLHRRDVCERNPGSVSGTRGQRGCCNQPAQQVCVHRQWFDCYCFMLPTYLNHKKSPVYVVLPNLEVSTHVSFIVSTSNCFVIIVNSNVFMQQSLLDSKHEETGIVFTTGGQ